MNVKCRKGLVVVLGVVAVAGASAVAGDYDSVVDDSVVGYWRFNDPSNYGKDASGHGSDITSWNNDAAGKSDSSRGGGYLELPRTVKDKSWFKTTYNYGTVAATVTTDRRFSMSRQEPGWTVATWVRGSGDFVESVTGATLFEFNADTEAFKSAIGDGKWHSLVIVYRPNSESDFYHVYLDGFDGNSLHDITSGGTDSKGNPAWHIPLSVGTTQQANDTVTLGGELGGKISILSISADFFGGLDDCLILDRELSSVWQGSSGERELFRLVKTGETFVFSNGSETSLDMFSSKGNWSNEKAPSAGLPYMIENGCEVKSSSTAIFAGKSLSVGRTEKLYGIKSVGGSKEVIVDNTVGKLTQSGANTKLTVSDLRLNDGVLSSTADGQALEADVKVSASSAKPFEINVLTGTYRITGRMTGGGVLVKRGAGALDLTGLTTLDAQIVLEAGTVKLPNETSGSIDYSGGTLDVVHEDGQEMKPILIRSSSFWPVLCTVSGEFGAASSNALFAVSNSVKEVEAADFSVATTVGMGLETQVRIEKGADVQLVWVDVVACDRYKIATDTFEECALNAAVTTIPGWTGEGFVVAGQPLIPTPPAYALDGVSHEKVLSVDGSAVRTYSKNFARDNQILDVLLQVQRGKLDATACAEAGVLTAQAAFGVDEDGCICVYHSDAAGAGTWSKLSFGSKSAFANDEWVRLTCVFDYCSNDDGVGFVQVRVNGNCGVSPDGVRSPTDLTACGSWFRLFERGGSDARKVSEFGIYGETQLDDVVVSAYKKSLKPETHTCENTVVDYSGTYGSGKQVQGKISYAQCDEKGIPRDLDFDSDGDGVSNGVELLKGTDPLDPNSFPGGGSLLIIR